LEIAVFGDGISAAGCTPYLAKFSADRLGFILRSNITLGRFGESSGYTYFTSGDLMIAGLI
jgi:hypothetical protein